MFRIPFQTTTNTRTTITQSYLKRGMDLSCAAQKEVEVISELRQVGEPQNNTFMSYLESGGGRGGWSGSQIIMPYPPTHTHRTIKMKKLNKRLLHIVGAATDRAMRCELTGIQLDLHQVLSWNLAAAALIWALRQRTHVHMCFLLGATDP